MSSESAIPNRNVRIFLTRREALAPSPAVRALLMVAGGALLAVSWPPLGLAAAPFIAFVLLMAGIEGTDSRTAFIGGALAGTAVGGLVCFQYSLSPLDFLMTSIIEAAFVGTWAAMSCIPKARLQPLLATVWPGAVWCGLEYLRAEVLPYQPHVPPIGLSQDNFIGQFLAPLVGAYGIGLIIVCWAGLVMVLSFRLRRGRESFIALAGIAVLLVLTLVPPRKFKHWPVRSLQTHEAVLVQPGSNDPSHPAKMTNASLKDEPKPLLIVWPLRSYAIDPIDEMAGPVAAELIGAAGKAEGALILGAPMTWRDRQREVTLPTVHVLNPRGFRITAAPLLTGNIFLSEDHARRKPPVTSMSASGPEPVRVASLTGRSEWIQGVSRRAVAEGAQILAYSLDGDSDDPDGLRELHLRQLLMRAMEVQRPLVATSWSGPTVACDPFGGVTELAPYGEASVTRAEIPPLPAFKSMFVIFGWMIGPAALMGFIVGSVLLLSPKRRWGNARVEPDEEELLED